MMIVDLPFAEIQMLVPLCISNSETIANFCDFIASVSGTVSLLPVKP